MKKLITTFIIIFTLLFGFQVVSAGTFRSNLEKTRSTSGLEKSGSVESIIGNFIGIGLSFVGVLFLVLMIYAGIKWMLSRGNEQEATQALHIITAAIIGLFIVISAYAITNFVFDAFKGETVDKTITSVCNSTALCTTNADCSGGICEGVVGAKTCTCLE